MTAQQKKFRFGNRTADPTSSQLALTAEDIQNLDSYVAKIGETLNILDKEIGAIKRGELEVIGQLFKEKSLMLKWLELRTPLIEPFLQHEFAQKLNIKGHLAELKKKIEEDGAMLSRMAVAARTVLREIEKINNRNGLGGVYGKTGQRLGAEKDQQNRFDEKI